MWLAMCLLYPELWDEFNGKCPTFKEFKSKYNGKDEFHNTFIEKLYMEELDSNTTDFQKKVSIKLQSQFLEDKFIRLIPRGRIFAICFSLIYGKYK